MRRDVDRLHEEALAKVNPKEGRACGFCFLDPSDDGGTMRKVLAYCAEIGFENVLVIDPLWYPRYKKLSVINPFSRYETHWEMSINHLLDAFQVTFEIEDQSKTSYINTYLSALFGLCQFANLTLADLVCFSVPPDKQSKKDTEKSDESHLRKFDRMRQSIYMLAHRRINAEDFPGEWRTVGKKYLAEIMSAYANIPSFVREAGSSARRLNVITGSPKMLHLFGHRKGVNFDRLISEGWIILANVSQGRDFGPLSARLLGTVITNQVISAIKRLRQHGFNKPYYLYIDEAAHYTTYTLADVLEHKRQIGLRTVLAHQHLGQLDNLQIRRAIESCTDIKCSFYISSPKNRREVMDMLGYGGELSPAEVAYNLSSQPKQDMVVKLSRQKPKVITAPTIPDSSADPWAYSDALSEDGHYLTFSDIAKDAKERLNVGKDSVRPERAAKPDNRANNRPAPSKVRHRAKDTSKDARPKADNPNTDAQPNVAWEGLFLENSGDKGQAD